jgi:predicted PurR-regulated permease PerM
VLVAIFLRSLADAVTRHTGVGAGWSVAITVLGLIVLVGGVGWVVASRLANQFGEFSHQLPASLDHIQRDLAQYPWGQALERLVQRTVRATPWTSTLVPLGFSVVQAAADAFVALFLGVVIAANPTLYVNGVLAIFPPASRARPRAVLRAVGESLRFWLLAQAMLMLVLGSLTALALWLIGMPLALLLGALTGGLLFVPYVGAIAAFTITELIAMSYGVTMALEAAGVYLVIHIAEAYVLAPLLQWDIVLLPPGLTVSAQLVIFALLGVPGLFIATPLTATLLVLIQVAYIEGTLHGPVPERVHRAARSA